MFNSSALLLHIFPGIEEPSESTLWSSGPNWKTLDYIIYSFKYIIKSYLLLNQTKL